jgi:hypothetical protein
MIWQEDPQVLAFWDQRAHFGGWAITCRCLRIMREADLFPDADAYGDPYVHPSAMLDRKLSEHGAPPVEFKRAFFEDCQRHWSNWAETEDPGYREDRRRYYVSVSVLLSELSGVVATVATS